MTKFYHGIAANFVGDAIIPLSQMATANPELYAEYRRKYEGRESVVERQIPLLDCGWADVVQLLPLHPSKLFNLQLELGLIEEIPDYNYFEIDSSNLDAAQAAVFFKTAPGDENTKVEWLRDVNIDDLQSIPEATRAYYASMRGTGEPVFNYQFVPHVLYRGQIDITNANRVNLRDLV